MRSSIRIALLLLALGTLGCARAPGSDAPAPPLAPKDSEPIVSLRAEDTRTIKAMNGHDLESLVLALTRLLESRNSSDARGLTRALDERFKLTCTDACLIEERTQVIE